MATGLYSTKCNVKTLVEERKKGYYVPASALKCRDPFRPEPQSRVIEEGGAGV